jgi:hypothetical protein
MGGVAEVWVGKSVSDSQLSKGCPLSTCTYIVQDRTQRARTHARTRTHLFADSAEPLEVLEKLVVAGLRGVEGVGGEGDLVACVGWVGDDPVDRLGEAILLPQVPALAKVAKRRLRERRHVVDTRKCLPARCVAHAKRSDGACEERRQNAKEKDARKSEGVQHSFVTSCDQVSKWLGQGGCASSKQGWARMNARCCLHDDLRIRLLGDKVLADREFQLCCTEKCGGTRGVVSVRRAARANHARQNKTGT